MSSESSASGRLPVATTSLPRKGPPAASNTQARKSMLSALLGEVSAANSEADSKINELNAARARNEELEADLQLTRESLEAKTVALAEVTGYKDQLSKDISSLRLEHEKVKEDLGVARSLLGDDDAAFTQMMTELRALRAKLAGTVAKLTPAKPTASSTDSSTAPAAS